MEMAAVPRDTQCPARGVGLMHTVHGGHECIHCGAITYRSDDAMDKLRAQFVEALQPPAFQVRLVSVVKGCESCGKPVERRDRLCDDCMFMRRVMFQRHRFLSGEMDEWDVPGTPITASPVTPVGHGSLDDWSAESIATACRR